MDANFSDKLKTVLSDPDAMATIAQLAKNFSQRSDPPAQHPDPGKPDHEEKGENDAPMLAPGAGGVGIGDLMRHPAIAEALGLLSHGSHERVALLQAMRPFVKEAKKEKLDRIIQTMKMLELLGSAQKLL